MNFKVIVKDLEEHTIEKVIPTLLLDQTSSRGCQLISQPLYFLWFLTIVFNNIPM